mgnify:CR=1 FL=1
MRHKIGFLAIHWQCNIMIIIIIIIIIIILIIFKEKNHY